MAKYQKSNSFFNGKYASGGAVDYELNRIQDSVNNISGDQIVNGLDGDSFNVSSGIISLKVMRQDDTTDSVNGNQVILTGWGFKTPGAVNLASEAVTFGVTFASAPIVVCTYAGVLVGSDPANVTALNSQVRNAVVFGRTAGTTGFTVVFATSDSANFDATHRIGYTWIAIGTLT